MTRPLDRFKDIHSHTVPEDEAGRDTTVVSIDYDQPIPAEVGGWYSVGLHPWSTAGMDTADIDRAVAAVEARAAAPGVVAIGECGIDRLRGGSPEMQEYAFRRLVSISESLEKPLIIHCVKSTDRILALHKELKPRQLWIIHGFRGNSSTARQLTSRGIAISLGRHFNLSATEDIDPLMIYHESDNTAQ